MKKWMKCIGLVACIVFLSSASVNAEEIYSPHVLKWNHFSGQEAYLKVNGDGLDSRTKGYLNTIYSRWNSSPYVYAELTSFSASTVDMTTATQSWWNSNVSDTFRTVIGITVLTDTNGNVVNSSYMASISSKKIRYAMISFSPYSDPYTSASFTRKAMVHELGHALCLGHVTSGTASIMRQGNVGYEYPQSYDYTVLANKYA